MSKIIKHSQRVETVTYDLVYTYVGKTRGHGFGFPCDKDGNILTGEMSPEGLVNLKACQDGTYAVTEDGVREYRHSYRESAILECDCGKHVHLDDCMTNRCAGCGSFYNGSGQALSHPSNWGEETNERFDDNGQQIAGYGEDY